MSVAEKLKMFCKKTKKKKTVTLREQLFNTISQSSFCKKMFKFCKI